VDNSAEERRVSTVDSTVPEGEVEVPSAGAANGQEGYGIAVCAATIKSAA
jgi:chemotaxis methyl-accepting protein methylase